MPPMGAPNRKATRRRAARLAALALLLVAAVSAGPSAAAGSTPGVPLPLPGKPGAGEGAKGSEPAAPAAIPLPSIIRSAEDAHRALARIGERLGDEAEVAEVVERLPALQKFVERLMPAGEPTLEMPDRDLADLRQAVLRNEQQLARWDGRLEDSVRTLDASRTELKRMGATWALTEESARSAEAPEQLLARIRDLRARVRTLEDKAQGRLGKALEVQVQVAALRLRIGDWLAAVERRERAREEQLLELESAPLWSSLGRPAKGAKLREQVLRSLEMQGRVLSAFAAAEWGALVSLAVAIGVLFLVVRKVARRFRARAEEDRALEAPAEVLKHPFAVAVLLTLSFSPWLFARPPVTVAEIAVLAMLPAFLRAVGGILPERVRRSVYGIAATFAASRVEALIPENSLLGRLVVIAVAAVALAGLVREIRRGSWAEDLPRASWRKAVRVLSLVAAVLFAVSLVANVVGNVTLAKRLANGMLASAVIAVLLFGTAQVLRALYVGLLHMPFAKGVGVVARHGALLEARGRKYIGWLAVAAWVYIALAMFRLTQPLEDAVAAVLSPRLKVGGLDVSLGDVVAFAVTLWLSVLLARLLSFFLEEGLEGRGLPRGVPAAISKTVSYTVVGVGFGFAVLASGMEVTRFTVLVGTLGVGIGFGLQNVVNNFVSGLILLYERPVQVGDIVEVGNVSGVVQRIGIRSSTIRTYPGAEVVVPNANLISGELVNWTLSDKLRRVDLAVGVAYGNDPAKVIEILLEVARGAEGVLENPGPGALFTGFGESSLDFQLRFWTHRFDSYMALASEIRLGVYRRLGEAGIEIPFPQRDLHLASVDPEAARALLGAARTGPPGRGEPGGG